MHSYCVTVSTTGNNDKPAIVSVMSLQLCHMLQISHCWVYWYAAEGEVMDGIV